jgi:hypothetical protein
MENGLLSPSVLMTEKGIQPDHSKHARQGFPI